MGITPNRGYPFPELGEDNNPPQDIQALALAIEADLDIELGDTDWIAASLTPPWTSYDGGSTFDIPSYRLKSGVVWAKGQAKDGAAGGVLWTFPPGMRPLKTRDFQVTGFGGAYNAVIRVLSTGVTSVLAFGSGSSNLSLSTEFSFIPEH